MKVAVITMSFPAPYETPASLHLARLHEAGLAISVFTLLPERADARKLTTERHLAPLQRFYPGFRSLLSGLGWALLQPRETLTFALWVFHHTRKKPVQLLKSFTLLPAALAITARLVRAPPDVVHLNLGHYPSLVGALVNKHLPEVALSMSLGAYDMLTRYGVSAPVAQCADLVRVLAEANVDFVCSTYGVPRERIAVIYDGIDLARGGRAVQRYRKVRYRVLTAGKLVKNKGVDTTLRVFQRTLRQFPEATLVILGDGPDRVRLEALSRALGLDAAVTFRGHVGQDEVFAEMAQAEVFLFMSRYLPERLPNVVKEAVACGCLGVVSRTPGIEELVCEKHAHIVDAHDVAGAAAAVRHALTDAAGRAALTGAARQRLERFSVERTVAQYRAHWERVRAAKRAPSHPAGQ